MTKEGAEAETGAPGVDILPFPCLVPLGKGGTGNGGRDVRSAASSASFSRRRGIPKSRDASTSRGLPGIIVGRVGRVGNGAGVPGMSGGLLCLGSGAPVATAAGGRRHRRHTTARGQRHRRCRCGRDPWGRGIKSSSDGIKVLVKIMRVFFVIYTSLEYLVKHNSSITSSVFLAGGDVRTTSLAKAT